MVEQGAGGATAAQPGIAGVEEGGLVVHDGGAGGGHRGETATPGPDILVSLSETDTRLFQVGREQKLIPPGNFP